MPGVRLVIPYENPMHTADTTYIFREADGTYMATHKLGEPAHPGGLVPYDVFAEGRRVMARRTSPDGSNWSPFETIIQPDIYDPQDFQIMELCVTPVRSGYLGVIGIYMNRTQTMELHLGGSVDGRIWDRRVRLPAVATGALGDYGGGMLWPSHNLIEHNGRHYMYFSATEGLHGDPASKSPDDLAILLRHLPCQLGCQSVLGGCLRPRRRRGGHADHASRCPCRRQAARP